MLRRQMISLLPLLGLPTPMLRGDRSRNADWLIRLSQFDLPLVLDISSFQNNLSHFERADAYTTTATTTPEAQALKPAVALGFHSDGLAFVLDDYLWDRWRLAGRFHLSEPQASELLRRRKHWFDRNSASAANKLLLACRRTLARWTDLHETTAIRNDSLALAEVETHLVSQTIVVDAMVTAMARHSGLAFPYVVSA